MTNENLLVGNQLQKEINQIEDFLQLLKIGGAYSEKHERQNKFNKLELRIFSNVWTGSQSPLRDSKLEYSEIIKKCADSMVLILEEELEKRKTEFKNLI
jgi:hypothetical protein